jgi:hypothetical protein
MATILFWCALFHFAGGRYFWRSGYRFSGACFVLNGVVMLAFAVSLVRNGAPGG